MSFLTETRTMVLNKNWQIIGATTPRCAFLQMSADAATGLDVTDDGNLIPTRWKDWLTLPVRQGDDSCGTIRGLVRLPRVIIAMNYAKVPRKKPRLNTKNLRVVYKDTCAITGVRVTSSTASKEHVTPVSKGGKTDWSNVVLAHKDVNSRRGNMPYEEAGLKSPRILPAPKELPVSETIRNVHDLPEWNLFLRRQKV